MPVQCTCRRCGRAFLTYPSRIADGRAQFCSHACKVGPRVERTCRRCGRAFSVTPARLSTGRGAFCSKDCATPARLERACEQCGSMFRVWPSQADARFCSTRCHGLSLRTGKNYVQTASGVHEHRLVWMRVHGPIPPGHVIHHINGDRRDNRIENLACMTRAEHNRLHENLPSVQRANARVTADSSTRYSPTP